MNIAKCVNYVSKVKSRKWLESVADVMFGIFTVTFAYSRLWLFPKQAIASVILESTEHLGQWSWFYVMAFMLFILQCLHIFWFSIIGNSLI